jgi:branched-chain amino acid transport system substrate-binding protein
MKKIRLVLLVSCISLLVSLFTFSSCKPQPAPSTPTPAKPPETTQTNTEPEVLKIGLVTSISGPMSAAFKGLYDAVEPAKAFYNDKGGITVNGKKYLIDIVAEDDQSSPAGAVAATNKIIQSGIKFMVNPIFPPSLYAVTPLANAAKVLGFTGSGSNHSIYTKENPYSFCCYADAYDEQPFYNYVQKNFPDVKKVALLRADDPAGEIVEGMLEEDLPKRGMKIVANERFVMDTQDFYPIVTKILAAKPDAIEMIISIPPWTAAITTAARDLGFTGPILACASCGDMNVTTAMISPEYSYDIFNAAIDPLSDKLPSITQDFSKLVEQTTGQPFNFDNFMLFNALVPAVEGIVKAQSFDPDTVVTTLENMTIDSPWGENAVFKGQEWGYQHLLTTEKMALTKIVKGGKVEFEYVPR